MSTPAPRRPSTTTPSNQSPEVLTGKVLEPYAPEMVKFGDRAANVAEVGLLRGIDVAAQELPGLLRERRATKVRLAEETTKQANAKVRLAEETTQQEKERTQQEELRLRQAQVRLQEVQALLQLEQLRREVGQPGVAES
ncbi:hypothetical protein ACFC6L_19250 [Kitasatospora phosalacinea]|uniref:hypothetical protein n=1 Tax=Kitasatospora phosalacinea TaxID=2065 RepID=UPI0035D95BD2